MPASMSTTTCYSARLSAEDVPLQLEQVTHRTLLLSYFNGNTNLNLGVPYSNYYYSYNHTFFHTGWSYSTKNCQLQQPPQSS